jgi:signal transduction histidine kinase
LLAEKSEALLVEVEDDGKGVGEDCRTGVGMSSMQERAEELGGTLAIGPGQGGGTLVRALLPCEVAYAIDHRKE